MAFERPKSLALDFVSVPGGCQHTFHVVEPNFDFTVPRISGVAHRANIVTFKVCATGCFFSDIVAATDTMIAHGVVDALNHSIGSSSGSPWGTPQGEAWKAARAAGIYVAESPAEMGSTMVEALRTFRKRKRAAKKRAATRKKTPRKKAKKKTRAGAR